MTYAARITALPPMTHQEFVTLWRQPYERIDEDSWFVEFARSIEKLVNERALQAAAAADTELTALRARVEELERDALIVSQVRDLLWNEQPECCGSPVVGAEYMGAREMVCCGCYEPAMLNDAQIVASLRALLPAAITTSKATGATA